MVDIISFDEKHTILVYIDGTCESLENFLDDRETVWRPIVDNPTHKIINIACFNVLDNHVMLTYFLRHDATGSMEFVYFLLNGDTLTPTANIHRLNIERKDIKEAMLSAFTVVEGVDYPSLMTICKYFVEKLKFKNPSIELKS